METATMTEVLTNKISIFRSCDFRFSSSRQSRLHDNFECGNNVTVIIPRTILISLMLILVNTRLEIHLITLVKDITKILIFPVEITIDLIDMIGFLLQSVQCVMVIVVLVKLLPIVKSKK